MSGLAQRSPPPALLPTKSPVTARDLLLVRLEPDYAPHTIGQYLL
jgi:hypothetical protein